MIYTREIIIVGRLARNNTDLPLGKSLVGYNHSLGAISRWFFSLIHIIR